MWFIERLQKGILIITIIYTPMGQQERILIIKLIIYTPTISLGN